MRKQKKQYIDRVWEVDALRGVAFLGMFMHHLFFALVWFEVLKPEIIAPFIGPLGVVVRWLFIGLVGVSSWLWFVQRHERDLQSAALRRAAPVALAAIGISAVSFVVTPQYYVQFGVLHLIATSIVLVVPFLFFADWAWIFAVAILVGTPLISVFFEIPSALRFIFMPETPPGMLDYFPVFPWFGVVLLGVWAGRVLYGKSKEQLNSKLNHFLPVLLEQFLVCIGKKALQLYVLHIPIVIAIAWGLSRVM